MTSKEDLEAILIARESIRLELLAAGMQTAQFDLEGHEGVVTSQMIQVADGEGIRLQNGALLQQASACMSRWVDANVPGWDANEGGRSRINWALQDNAWAHSHYDNVTFERRRVLPDSSGASDGYILAENATAATLLAMGELAPKSPAARVRVMTAIAVLTERERSNQPRFLTEKQRDLLTNAVWATRMVRGLDEAWIGEVIMHGHLGCLGAPDVELVQMVARERLGDLVEAMTGPPSTEHSRVRAAEVRAQLIESLTLPQSITALQDIVDEGDEEMLLALGEEGVIDYPPPETCASPQIAI